MNMKTSRINCFYLTAILGFMVSQSGMAQEISVKYDLNSLCENNQLEVFNRKVVGFFRK